MFYFCRMLPKIIVDLKSHLHVFHQTFACLSKDTYSVSNITIPLKIRLTQFSYPSKKDSLNGNISMP